MIYTSNDGLRMYSQKNVLSIEEACDLLKVSRQYLYKLVNDGKVSTLKQVKNGFLFFKPDLLAFNEKRQVNAGYGCSTRRAIEDFDKLNIIPSEIDSIHIYRYDWDAAMEGFYTVRGGEEKDTLKDISAPTFIIKMRDSTEYWFDGILCGYVGTGTRGCAEVLYKLGIVDSYTSKEIGIYLASSYVMHIYNTGNGWETTREDGYWESLWNVENKVFGVHCKMYSYNGKLVLAVERHGINYTEQFEQLTPELIEKCFEFMDDVATVEQLSKDVALETGHFVNISSLTNIFQTILSNGRDRELWMLYPNDENYEAEHKTMREILKNLGLELTETEISKSLWDKLVEIPRIISRK